MANRSSSRDLNTFWDRLLRRKGKAAPTEGTLDPSLAETVRAIHELDDMPAAGAAFRRDLLRDLLSAGEQVETPANANTPYRPSGRRSASFDPGRRSRPAIWMEAAALGVMILILGSLVTIAVLSGLFSNADDDAPPPTSMVGGFGTEGASATPSTALPPSPAARVPATGIAELPVLEGTTHVALWRLSLQPGGAWTSPESRPILLQVTSGTLDVAAGETGLSTLVSGETTTGNGAVQVANRSSAPAGALVVLVGPVVRDLRAEGDATLEPLAGGPANGIPDGPIAIAIAHLAVDTTTLAAGNDAASLVVIERGTVRATVGAGSVHLRTVALDGTIVSPEAASELDVSEDAYTVRVGDALALTAGGSVQVQGDGPDSAGIIVVTVEPARD